MTARTQTQQAATDRLPTDAQRVGRDGEGHEHYHSRIRDAVYVLRDGRPERHDLHDRGLSDWVAFVDDIRGWDDCRYNEDGIVGLLGTLDAQSEN